MKPIKNNDYGSIVGTIYKVGPGGFMSRGYHVRVTSVTGIDIYYEYLDHPSRQMREESFNRSRESFFSQAILEKTYETNP